MNSVKDKVAIVTGGGSGIGEATCELLAKAGAKIVVTDISLASADRTVEKILNSGGEAIAVQHDVASEENWEKVIDATVKRFSKLDVLVNNAGMSIASVCKDTSLADWQRVVDVNLSGAFLGIRSAINTMLDNEGTGSIINVSSTYGLVGGGFASYCASKGAITALTKSVAVECGRLGQDIRVNAVYPGCVNTPMTDNAAGANQVKNSEAQAELVAKISKARVELFKKIPLGGGRFAEPIEIARGILFLASDDSSYMTGSSLVIDGGYTAV